MPKNNFEFFILLPFTSPSSEHTIRPACSPDKPASYTYPECPTPLHHPHQRRGSQVTFTKMERKQETGAFNQIKDTKLSERLGEKEFWGLERWWAERNISRGGYFDYSTKFRFSLRIHNLHNQAARAAILADFTFLPPPPPISPSTGSGSFMPLFPPAIFSSLACLHTVYLLILFELPISSLS